MGAWLAAPSRWGYFAAMRGALLVFGLALAALPACRAKVPLIDAPFSDDFERAELGPTWNATSPEPSTRSDPASIGLEAEPSGAGSPATGFI